MSLGQILRKRREELNFTLDFVSSKVGFSKPYLSTIETGKVKNPPSDELLRKLEGLFEFEPGLLLHIAHMERLPADIRQGFEAAEAQNDRWREVIKNLVEQKLPIEQLPSKLAESRLDIEHDKAAMKAGRLVPIINKLAAGYPTDFDDLDYPVGHAEDYIRCPDVHDANAFAVHVFGDSMEPRFHDGDIVVFSPAAEVHNGDDCFVRFAAPHETTFKRIFFEESDQVRLQPRNEKYAPLIADGKRITGIYRAIRKIENL